MDQDCRLTATKCDPPAAGRGAPAAGIDPIGLRFRIRRGAWADYLALARYHYRAARPATVCQVWRLTACPGPQMRKSPTWRGRGYPALAGVLVVSYPTLQSAARNIVTADRYCTRPSRRVGLRRLNREVRTISRVIIHPLYRGLGLATRLVAGVLRRLAASGRPRLVEAFARMGLYVPFFRHAGMHELRLPGKPVYYYRFRQRRRSSRPAE